MSRGYFFAQRHLRTQRLFSPISGVIGISLRLPPNSSRCASLPRQSSRSLCWSWVKSSCDVPDSAVVSTVFQCFHVGQLSSRVLFSLFYSEYTERTNSSIFSFERLLNHRARIRAQKDRACESTQRAGKVGPLFRVVDPLFVRRSLRDQFGAQANSN